MVVARFFFVFVLVTVCFEYIFAAPRADPAAVLDRKDLVQRFAEFLQDDQELSGVLGKINWDEERSVRNKRQATSTTQGLDSGEFDVNQEKPGFFDRAAKFVTELVQRFLKWINSSENN